jgi:polyisoprenoid-binding protein YceI
MHRPSTTATRQLSELTGDYVFDATATRIGFVARHTMATKVPGHFEAFSGRAHLDGDDPAKSTVELTIQAASIQTRNAGRDRALRDKFLDATTHPTITFTSTEVTRVDDATFILTGDLTIRGSTNPIAIDLTLAGTAGDQIAFTGTATIDRRKWGASWRATGPLVSRTVLLDLAVTAVRRSSPAVRLVEPPADPPAADLRLA